MRKRIERKEKKEAREKLKVPVPQKEMLESKFEDILTKSGLTKRCVDDYLTVHNLGWPALAQ